MNNFRKSYQEAMSRVRIPEITAETVLSEARHKKSAADRRRRRITAFASAACLFLLCSAVAVTAGYISVIRVSERGFKTADEQTMLLNDAMNAEEGYSEDIRGAGAVADAAQESLSDEDLSAGIVFVEEEGREYFSLGELKAGEPGLVTAMPDLELLGGTVKEQSYLVRGNYLTVRVQADDRYFMIDQANYNGTQGHATSTVYPSGVCNQREYTTAGGFMWQLLDSVRSEGETLKIHAAAAAYGYELVVDFDGYTEEEVFAVLENMDLNVYRQ